MPCSTLFAALIVQLQLHKLSWLLLWGFVQQVVIRLQTCKVIQTDKHNQGTLMSDSMPHFMLGACLGPMQLFAAICWLLCCNCLQGFVQRATARYRLQGVSDCVNTQQTGSRAFTMLCKAVQNKPKLQLFAGLIWLPWMHRVCATCQYNPAAGCTVCSDQ
jgi:hypothetical protein